MQSYLFTAIVLENPVSAHGQLALLTCPCLYLACLCYSGSWKHKLGAYLANCGYKLTEIQIRAHWMKQFVVFLTPILERSPRSAQATYIVVCFRICWDFWRAEVTRGRSLPYPDPLGVGSFRSALFKNICCELQLGLKTSETRLPIPAMYNHENPLCW